MVIYYGCKLNYDNVFSQDKKNGKNKLKIGLSGLADFRIEYTKSV